MKTIRRLTVVLTAILIIALAAVTASAADSRTAKTSAKKLTTVNASQAYQLLNNYRSQYNKQVKNSSQKIGTLKRDAELEKIAQTRAKEMAQTGKFSHTRPNGQRGITLIKGNKAKGENIARGYRTCKDVSAAWYKSKGHRDNVLRKNFKKVGIAGCTRNGMTYWVQIYSS